MDNVINDLEFATLVLLWYRNHMLDQIQVSLDYITNPEWADKNITYFELEIEKTLAVYDRLNEYINTLRK